MSKETIKQEGLYYGIIDGTFRRKVSEGTPGAVRRIYENRNGEKGVKYEMVIDSLEGKIEDMRIIEGDYGRVLNIKLDPNANQVNPNLQFSIETSYGEDLLKKIPAIDFSKPVKFRPYAFTNQTNGREVRGVELKQDETSKITNFFLDEDKNPLHGLPPFPENTDNLTKDDWQIHFKTVRKFLITYFTDTVLPKFESVRATTVTKSPTVADTDISYPDTDLTEDDIPF